VDCQFPLQLTASIEIELNPDPNLDKGAPRQLEQRSRFRELFPQPKLESHNAQSIQVRSRFAESPLG
jgi:hypothetical protein